MYYIYHRDRTLISHVSLGYSGVLGRIGGLIGADIVYAVDEILRY